ncbi:MAG: hypothetical protein ACKO1M_12305 [Planctomycetota bacterium]
MTTAERWTVYPLLLLAIGLAMRGQLGLDASPAAGRTISADTVVCRELAVLGEADAIIIHAGRVEGGGGGRIEIRDPQGVDAMAVGTTAESRHGAVEFFDEQARLIGRLGPPVGGQPAKNTQDAAAATAE